MLKHQLNVCISLVLIFLCCSVKAQTIINSSQTWSATASYPGDYVIQSGATLTIDGDIDVTGKITVNGTARIEVVNGGKLNCTELRLNNAAVNEVNNGTLITDIYMIDGANSTLLITNNGVVGQQMIDIAGTNTVKVENNGVISLFSNGRINVHKGATQGGRLYVTNSKITSWAPNNVWYGISVVGGNGTSSNFPYARQSQGRFGMAVFNNAMIENSDWGVVNWDRTGGAVTDWSGLYSGGGIIQATNTVFKNNNNSVQFKKYQNQNTTGAWLNDESFLHGCTFIVDPTARQSTFNGMVRLENVYGVDILGCYFENSAGLTGEAVYAYASKFKVDGWCPCGSLPKPTCYATATNPCVGGTFQLTTFHNTDKAIYANNILDGNRTVSIQNTKFYNIREYAISLQGAIKPSIINNEINLKQTGSNQVKGIALGGCLAYTVMNNRIANITSNTGNTFGILINSSQQPYNEKVKLNTLGYTATQGSGSLNYALQARGLNYDVSKPSNGLKIFCNNMSSNTNNDATDITVTDLPGDPYHGISSIQGEISNHTYGAENIFATRSTPNGYNQLYKTSVVNPFIYYYYTGGIGKNPTNKLPSIQTSGTSQWLSCDLLGNGNTSGGSTTKVYTDYVSDRAALELQLSASNVFDVDEETGYCAYDDLIAQYCVLNETMLEHYLNPGQTYSLGLDSLTGDTIYFPDTVVYHPDSIILVLQGCNFLYPYKIWLAGMYAQQGNYDDAYTELNAIAANFTLTTHETDALNDYATLLEVRETLEGNDDNWTDIPQATRDWITDAAYNGYGTLRYMARAFLSRYEGISLIPEGWQPEEGEAKQNNTSDDYRITSFTEQQQTDVRIYPNPAHNTLYIVTTGTIQQAIAEIYDITGRLIITKNIAASSTTDINIEKLLPGNYILKLRSGNTNITVQRLTKQ